MTLLLLLFGKLAQQVDHFIGNRLAGCLPESSFEMLGYRIALTSGTIVLRGFHWLVALASAPLSGGRCCFARWLLLIGHAAQRANYGLVPSLAYEYTSPDSADVTTASHLGSHSMSEADQIAQHLPNLRRFSRALCGNQQSGDAYVRGTLEAIIADRSILDRARDLRVELYRVFIGIWSSASIQAHTDVTGDRLQQKAHERLSRLTPRSRQALLLMSLEGFSANEAAQILDAEAEEIEALAASARSEISSQLASKVLIIEDEAMIAADLEDIVISMGHSATGVATTRQQARELVSQDAPDLVLSDIQLADGSSGLDAVEDIIASFDVPVIFITAYPERLLTGERPEPTFLISKPFKNESVRSTISQALFFEMTAGAPK